MKPRPRSSPGSCGKGDLPRGIGKGYRETYDRIYGKKCRIPHTHDETCEGYDQEPSKDKKNVDEKTSDTDKA